MKLKQKDEIKHVSDVTKDKKKLKKQSQGQWDILIQLLSTLLTIPSQSATKYVKPTKSIFWDDQDHNKLQSSHCYQHHAKLLALHLIKWFGDQTTIEQKVDKLIETKTNKSKSDKKQKNQSKSDRVDDTKKSENKIDQVADTKEPSQEKPKQYNRLMWRPEVNELLELFSTDSDPLIAYEALSTPNWKITQKKQATRGGRSRGGRSRGRGRGRGRW